MRVVVVGGRSRADYLIGALRDMLGAKNVVLK